MNMFLASRQCGYPICRSSAKWKIWTQAGDRKLIFPSQKSIIQPMMKSWPQALQPPCLRLLVLASWMGERSMHHGPVSHYHWYHTWFPMPPEGHIFTEGQRVASDCAHPILPGHCSWWSAVVVTEQGRKRTVRARTTQKLRLWVPNTRSTVLLDLRYKTQTQR